MRWSHFIVLVIAVFTVIVASNGVVGPGSINGPRDQRQHPLQGSAIVSSEKRPQTFVALGDSFAAGPGAGNCVSWWDLFNTCRRSDHSYPAVVSSDPTFGVRDHNTFNFRACTGARVQDVLKSDDGGSLGSQLEVASQKADITTLSISGNDVGFFDVLNQCIYHFGGGGSPDDCIEALNTTSSIVTDPAFDQSLDLVIQGALENAVGAPAPQLIVTGYAQFFNSEAIQCNNATFCIWENPTKNHTCPLLTQPLRRTINTLVQAMNAKLLSATKRAQSSTTMINPNATIRFIDYDASFTGHRFCESDNVEPAFANPDVWFYQTWGNAGEGSPPDDTPIPEPSYDDVDPETCLVEAEQSGDWGKLAICHMARAKERDPDLQPEIKSAQLDESDWSSWITPNQLARIFHPKIGGHHIIAQHILEYLNGTDTG